MRKQLTAVLSLLCCCACLQAAPLKVMTEEFIPYSYYHNGRLTGFSVEVMRHLMHKRGLRSNIWVYPWARAYQEIKHHDDRVLFATARTADRENLFKWVGPLLEDPVCFFSNIAIDNPKHFTEARARQLPSIVVSRDYPEHKLLSQQGFTNLVLTSSAEQSFKLMDMHRSQVMVIGELVARYQQQHNPHQRGKLKKLEPCLFSSALYIAFSLNISDDEINRWQSLLERFKQSQDYQKLQQQFLF